MSRDALNERTHIMTTKQTAARTLVPLGSARAKTQAPGGISKLEPVTNFHYD
jgi:thymidine phosphorylase